MTEHRLSLDGVWDFQIDSGDGIDASHIRDWRQAVVPMPWQAQFEDLRHTSGVVWYRRNFTVDPGLLRSTSAGAAILHFGAVDYQATVWLNGERVGEHEGGYLPFEFNVIDLLLEGDNELLVRVVDSTDDRHLYPDFPFSEVPHGKQSWYGPIGGIWQSLWLELRPRLHIAQFWVAPSPGDATLAVKVALNGTPSGAFQVVCTVTGPDGQPAGSGVLGEGLAGVIRLDQAPQLWSPNSPSLYTVDALLTIVGQAVHSVR